MNMIRRIVTSKIVISSVLLAILLTSIPLPYDVQAQSLRLIVSAAQNPEFNNHFFGPQIVQVIIDDPGARDPDRSTAGLQVKGTSVPRVHLTDGLWYHFFAQENTFGIFMDVMTDGVRDNRIAVTTTAGLPTSVIMGSTTYSLETDASSWVIRIGSESGTGLVFVQVDKAQIFPTLPDAFTIGTNPDRVRGVFTWPYIVLIPINELDQVSIRAGIVSVNLTYKDFPTSISTSIDRTSYPVNAEIILSYTDFMWNINPVEEDVVEWVLDKNTGTPAKVLYRLTRNFQPPFAPDLLPMLFRPELGFDSRQVLQVDSQGMQSLKFFLQFDTTTNQVSPVAGVARTAENARLISEAPFTNVSILPVIQMIERQPNNARFESVDTLQGSRSNIFAGVRDMVASFSYFDIVRSAGGFGHDAFVSTDKEVYSSSDRAIFTVTDQDLNQRSGVSETYDGVLSRAFINVGRPFPLANNPTINTLPRVGDNFAANAITGVGFSPGVAGTAERIDINQDGIIDFFANSNDVTGLKPARSPLLALDFTTQSNKNAIVVNTALTLANINDVLQFTMSKQELTTKVDPFVLKVGKFTPDLGPASPDQQIQVKFPKYNLVQVDVRHVKLQSPFTKAVVEVEATDSMNTVSTIVDFPLTEPIGYMTKQSDIGVLKTLDLIDAAMASNRNLSSWNVKVTLLFLTAANTPLNMNLDTHQAVIDIIGLGVIRAEGATKDNIRLNAFSNMVYRPTLKEQGVNSPAFVARADMMTVLHNDRFQTLKQTIVTIGDPVRLWLPERFAPPNRLALTYTDIDVARNIRQVTGTFIYETKTATVTWDRPQYRFNQIAYLTIVDQDLNRRPDAIEQYSVPQDGFLFFEFGRNRADTECQNISPMPTGCLAGFVRATLIETGPNTGVFVVEIKMPREVLLEDGRLFRTFTSEIRANYVDVRDGSSNVNIISAEVPIRSAIPWVTEVVEEPEVKPKVAQQGSRIIQIDRETYHLNGRVFISVVDPQKNLDPFRSDIIFISVTKSDGTGITRYRLVETGANTGNFTGYITLSGPTGTDGGVGPRDGELSVRRGDSVSVSFEGLAVSAFIDYYRGIVFWDSDVYDIGDQAILTVIDLDMSRNPDMRDEVSVTVEVNARTKNVQLKETEANSGKFVASIRLISFGEREMENEIAVSIGDVLNVVYEDRTLPSPFPIIDSARQLTQTEMISDEAAIQFADAPERVRVSRPSIIDADGRGVNIMRPDESYRIETQVTNLADEIEFVHILQVKDSDNVIVHISVIHGAVDADRIDKFSHDLKIMERGEYTIEVYVWDSLESPTPLYMVQRVNVVVE